MRCCRLTFAVAHAMRCCCLDGRSSAVRFLAKGDDVVAAVLFGTVTCRSVFSCIELFFTGISGCVITWAFGVLFCLRGLVAARVSIVGVRCSSIAIAGAAT